MLVKVEVYDFSICNPFINSHSCSFYLFVPPLYVKTMFSYVFWVFLLIYFMSLEHCITHKRLLSAVQAEASTPRRVSRCPLKNLKRVTLYNDEGISILWSWPNNILFCIRKKCFLTDKPSWQRPRREWLRALLWRADEVCFLKIILLCCFICRRSIQTGNLRHFLRSACYIDHAKTLAY